MQNTLAYYAVLLVTTVKSFLGHALERGSMTLGRITFVQQAFVQLNICSIHQGWQVSLCVGQMSVGQMLFDSKARSPRKFNTVGEKQLGLGFCFSQRVNCKLSLG
jgi:hypothetical protein